MGRQSRCDASVRNLTDLDAEPIHNRCVTVEELVRGAIWRKRRLMGAERRKLAERLAAMQSIAKLSRLQAGDGERYHTAVTRR
jgi:hypothetical protein